jgi:aminomuconate-semialdehyde/2-hydroxymuconate-6-semialdehyde dehydrogenase
MHRDPHWIDGKPRPARQRAVAGCVRPRHGARSRSQVADGDARDVTPPCRPHRPHSPHGRRFRTASVRAGWNGWPTRSSAQRRIRACRGRDAGKPLALARDIEIPRAVANLRFFAHAATQFASESHHGEAGLNYTLRAAAGRGRLHLAVEPAAVPVHLEDRAGAGRRQYRGRQAVRGHPVAPRRCWASWRPRSACHGGVLNIVHGLGPAVGEPMVLHPAIKAISSPAAPRWAAASPALAGPMLKKTRWNWAARTPPWCSPTATGASTWTRCPQRLPEQRADLPVRLAPAGERSIYDEFRDAFVERVQRIAHRRSA